MRKQLQRLFNRNPGREQPRCPHDGRVQAITPQAQGCQECLDSGEAWVNLRLCLTCGHVGCCDSSPNKHATKHYHKTGHAVIQTLEPGQNWCWCYEHQVWLEPPAQQTP